MFDVNDALREGLDLAEQLDEENNIPEKPYVEWINQSYTVEEAFASRGDEIIANQNKKLTPFEILMINRNPNNRAIPGKLINDTLLHCMKKLNYEYASTLLAGKPAVIREFNCPSFDHETFDLLSVPGAKKWHDNNFAYKAAKGKKGELIIKQVNIISEWWKWPGRKSYPNGIVMAPNQQPVGAYNLFKGFPIVPKLGNWDLFKKLILVVICSNDKQLYEWVIDWMATGIQTPETLKGVALVMRGAKGVGKGQFAKYYGKLFGRHYLHVTHDKHLIGNFNAHQAQALLLFADELIWGGNKSSEGVLKALITEDSIMLERKGFDSYRIRNYLRLLVASNESWAVPAGAGERRWCICDCSDIYKEDHTFFAALEVQMLNGGLEAMMHDLQHRVIITNQRKAPKTAALTDIAIKGFTPVQRWLFTMLEDSETSQVSHNNINWCDSDTVDNLYDSYKFFCNTNHIRDHDTKSTMSKQLKKLLNLTDPKRPRDINKKKVSTYELPSLEVARKSFAEAVNLNFDWD